MQEEGTCICNSWRGRGTGKESVYLGTGWEILPLQNGAGEGWVRKP